MSRKQSNLTKNWLRRDKRVALLLRDDRRCVYCTAGYAQGVLTADHIAERAGAEPNNGWSNLVTSCMLCNSTKRHDGIEALAQRRQLDLTGIRARIQNQRRRGLKQRRKQAQGLLLTPMAPWLLWAQHAYAPGGPMPTPTLLPLPLDRIPCDHRGGHVGPCNTCMDAYIDSLPDFYGLFLPRIDPDAEEIF